MRHFIPILLSSTLLFSSHAFAQSSCGALPAPQTEGKNDIGKTAMASAAAGAVLGGVFGKEKKNKDTLKNAAIGAAAGAAIGAVLGKEASDRRKEYSSQSAFLECEINYTQSQIDARKAKIASVRQEIDKNIQRSTKLITLYKQNQASSIELRAMKASLNSQVLDLDTEIDSVQAEINTIDQMTPNITPINGESEEELNDRKAKLIQHRTVLHAQYLELIGAKDRLLVASTQLENSLSG